MKFSALITCLHLLICFSAYAEIDRQQIKSIPVECNTLVAIDMEKIMANPILSKLILDSSNKNMKKINDLGITPADVESVIIGFNSTKMIHKPAAFEKQPEIIAVTRVQTGVSLEKIAETAKKDNAEVKLHKLEGFNAAKIKKSGKEFTLLQLEKDVIVIGSLELIKKSIELKKSGGDSILKDKQIGKLSAEQKSMFWIVGRAPEEKNNTDSGEPLDNPQEDLMKSIEMFTLNLGLEEGILKISSKLFHKDEESAKKFLSMVQFIVTVATSQDGSPVKSDQVKLSSMNNTVKIQISMDLLSLGKAIKAAKKMAEE